MNYWQNNLYLYISLTYDKDGMRKYLEVNTKCGGLLAAHTYVNMPAFVLQRFFYALSLPASAGKFQRMKKSFSNCETRHGVLRVFSRNGVRRSPAKQHWHARYSTRF